MRDSERRFRSLFQDSPIGNRAAGAYMNVDPASLEGRTRRELFPPEVADRHVARIRRVFETGQATETEDLYRFGPREVWLNIARKVQEEK